MECNFEFSQMNTLLMYAFDLDKMHIIEKIKLYFESDVKGLFKINIKMSYPDSKGNPVTFLQT